MGCEIYPIGYRKSEKKTSFRWKWRHVAADGRVSESKHEYELFYECVCAARESGYEPQAILRPSAAPA